MKAITDIDIDVKDRNDLLQHLNFISATSIKKGEIVKHNVGIYLQKVPVDPVTKICSLDYLEAEARGYIKFDILNVNVYKNICSEEHLVSLISKEPNWDILTDPDKIKNLFHIGEYYNILSLTRPKSVEQLAMVLALIRPGKRYLLNKSWDDIERDVWKPAEDGEYVFKKSHAISYALVIVAQMNLMEEVSCD